MNREKEKCVLSCEFLCVDDTAIDKAVSLVPRLEIGRRSVTGWLSLSTRRGQVPTAATTPLIRTDDTIIARTNTLLTTTKPLQDGTENHTRARENARITHARLTITAGAYSSLAVL